MILLDSPKLRQTSWIHNFEDASVTTLPRDVIAVPLLVIVEKLLQEIPQQSSV
jgi:hypothetical protein